MKCARCHRFMLKPAATVTAQGHQVGYGPRCAEVMELVPPKLRHTRSTMRRARKNDKQMELLA